MTANIYSLTDTWSVGATVYKSIQMTITDTAYAAGSKMIDISSAVAGGSFTVDVDGNIVTTGTITATGAIAASNIFAHAYGIMSVQGGSTAEATTDATPRKIAAWNTDGLASGLTVDETADEITITTDGIYLVFASVSYSGSNTSTYDVEIYKVAAGSGDSSLRKLGTGGDVGNASGFTIMTCVAGDTISLFHSSTDGGSAFTAAEAQLIVVRIA